MRETNLTRLDNTNTTKKSTIFLHYIFLFRDLKYAISKYAKGTVLDIGCGNKPYISFFPTEIKYIGCDIIQSSKNQVDVICEATNIPLQDEHFDTVFSTQTIEHVYNHKKMLSEAHRLLKPQGYIIFSGPMYWPHHEEPYDFFRFTKHGFENLLIESGFEVREILPNGGKWALWGVVTLQTLPQWLANLRIIKWTINTICYKLDTKYPDYKNTMNFVVVAQKK